MNALRTITLRLTPDQSLDPEKHILAALPADCAHYQVTRRSIDARGGKVVVQFLVAALDAPPGAMLMPPPEPATGEGPAILVVGAGPAGLGAACALQQRGLRPIVLDRGAPFPARHREARALRLNGRLEGTVPPFTGGLGGAGAYSDGKLFTRRGGATVSRAMHLMAWFANDESLLVEAHPHVGSNRLPQLVERMRVFLEERGARFLFAREAVELVLGDGRVRGLRLSDGEEMEAAAVVLAPGNSSRTLIAALHDQGVAMEARPFAVGLRVEHPRKLIDGIQYGDLAGHPALGAARYSFAFSRLPRPIYTFCMCPGGHLLPTPPEAEHLAVNGMSFASRSSKFSNAAVVAAVSPDDWPDDRDSPLAGIAFQRRIEAECFARGGGGYLAPAQRLTDFLVGRKGDLPECTYRPGVTPADLAALLPAPIVEALREGLRRAGQRLPGYLTDEAILVAPETLTSSPVRILRHRNGESLSHPGLFPCGEGSGWAGGITSSFADGLEVGDAVVEHVR